MVKIDVNTDGALEEMKEFADAQLPFATALALTRTAQREQTVVRDLEDRRKGGVFTLRNDWTTRNTKIEPATKANPTATVYTDTSNQKTGAPDYLKAQEEGADKVPVAGHHHIAIPTTYLRKYAPAGRPIPDNLRAKNLFPPGVDVQLRKVYAGTFRAGKDNGERRAIPGRAMKKLGTSEYEAFVRYPRNSGTLCIFVRSGATGHDAEPWYILVTEAHIQARFGMEQTVEATAQAIFEEEFRKALIETHPFEL